MKHLSSTLTAAAVGVALLAAQSIHTASAQSFVRDALPAPATATATATASDLSAPRTDVYRAPDGGVVVRVPAPATIVRDPSLEDVAAQAAALRPGESTWLAGAPTQGAVLIVVDLAGQRATVYRDGRPVAITTVSSGTTGRETPTGTFPILGKEKIHHSNLYNSAPMPFMQRLTWHGVALHAGKLPGYPASHGCVRLPRAFAEQLFGVTRRGDLVVVSDDSSSEALMRAGLQPWMAMQVGDLSGAGAGAQLAVEDHGGSAGRAGLAAQ